VIEGRSTAKYVFAAVIIEVWAHSSDVHDVGDGGQRKIEQIVAMPEEIAAVKK